MILNNLGVKRLNNFRIKVSLTVTHEFLFDADTELTKQQLKELLASTDEASTKIIKDNCKINSCVTEDRRESWSYKIMKRIKFLKSKKRG
jgi:hypothetical protein